MTTMSPDWKWRREWRWSMHNLCNIFSLSKLVIFLSFDDHAHISRILFTYTYNVEWGTACSRLLCNKLNTSLRKIIICVFVVLINYFLYIITRRYIIQVSVIQTPIKYAFGRWRYSTYLSFSPATDLFLFSSNTTFPLTTPGALFCVASQ